MVNEILCLLDQNIDMCGCVLPLNLSSASINNLLILGRLVTLRVSLRDGFNLGYDVILISDATSSGMKKHYETTLERVHDYYGLVMDLSSLKKILNVFGQQRRDGDTT